MRRFHSYGPVDAKYHFCVQRTKLVDQCTNLLVGNNGEDGDYFTLWAPRQTGKTWLMRQVKRQIDTRHKNKYILGDMSMQGVILADDESEDIFLKKIPKIMLDAFNIEIDAPSTWEDWVMYFHHRKGLFDRPVILFFDEFDSLPSKVIDRLVTLFRDMYLMREKYLLHGLVLIGVRAVLGVESDRGSPFNIQRSFPFIQERLYNALTHDLVGDRMPILALDPLDEMEDVFAGNRLDLPALIQRYSDYLARLNTKGLNSWKDQPRLADMHLTEAVGHFHLYAWLQAAVGRRCIISPEFPTGNGKVDIHLKCGDKQGIIEVKSFVDATQAKQARVEAAQYAKNLSFEEVTIALFVPVEDEEVLQKLSGEEEIDDIRVIVAAIGWT